MAVANSAILLFIFPQLTWKGTISQSRAVAPELSTSFPYPLINPLFLNHRHHYTRNFSVLSSSSALPHTSRLRSSPPTSTFFIRHGPFLLNGCYKKNHKQHNGDVSTNPPQKASFSTAPRWSRDHHFDTLKVVQRLKDEGFSEEQSRAMMLVLSDVIEESIQNLTRTMVLREGMPFYQFSFVAINL